METGRRNESCGLFPFVIGEPEFYRPQISRL